MKGLALALLLAACATRTSASVDTKALLAKRGPIEAHRDLEMRVLEDKRDLGARLALAALDDQIGRPSEAIEELEAVERSGGPFGPRWHDEDRARLARLLLERGTVRIAQARAGALADLDRARSLGAAVPDAAVARARELLAIAKLRHVDAGVRASGRTGAGQPVTTVEERGRFGAWAWANGARREAFEQLAAWHAATAEPRDAALAAAYLRALAWWSPPEAAAPSEATGATRCWFASAGCAPPAAGAQPLELVAPDGAEPHAWAVVRYARARASAPADELYAVARAFAREPLVGERLGRDLVAHAVDAAEAHAALGALYDALGDAARARASWQAAVDAAPEPAFVRGLAEAAARAGDGSAALVFATRAAAAWGDPAVVWVSVARALEDRGDHTNALTAAASALELGDVETLPRALAVAEQASRALGRTAQADALVRRRQTLSTAPAADSALLALRARPSADNVARAWVIALDRPRDVELRAAMLDAMPADDPRRPTVIGELVALAGDLDATIGFIALRAVRTR